MKLNKAMNIFLSVFLILMVIPSAVSAAEDDESNSGYSGEDFFNDHINLEDANTQISDSAIGDPASKFTNYALYAYAVAIVLYMGLLAKWFFIDGGEGKTKAFIGAIAFFVFVALQYSLTIEALNVVAGN